MPDRDCENHTGKPFADEAVRLDAQLFAEIEGAWPATLTWYYCGPGRTVTRYLWICLCDRRTRYIYRTEEGWRCRGCAKRHYRSEWECRATRAAHRARRLTEAAAKASSFTQERRAEEIAREELQSVTLSEKWFLERLAEGEQ